MNQYNAVSNKSYEGLNQEHLKEMKIKNSFESDKWVTFLQARNMGLKIKKGSHGVSIFRGFGTVELKDKEGKIKVSSAPLGFARVFNLDQTEK